MKSHFSTSQERHRYHQGQYRYELYPPHHREVRHSSNTQTVTHRPHNQYRSTARASFPPSRREATYTPVGQYSSASRASYPPSRREAEVEHLRATVEDMRRRLARQDRESKASGFSYFDNHQGYR